MVLHAALGLGGLLVAAVPYGHKIVPYFTMFESSTIFLQTNYLCIKLFGNDSAQFKVSNFIFSLLFFIFRILGGPYYLINAHVMTLDPKNTAHPAIKTIFLFNGLALCLLSNYWFWTPIIKSFFGPGKKTRKNIASEEPVKSITDAENKEEITAVKMNPIMEVHEEEINETPNDLKVADIDQANDPKFLAELSNLLTAEEIGTPLDTE